MDNPNIEPMLLWVPVYSEMPEEEADDLILKVSLANDAILDFSEGIITLDETFQTIEQFGANIDEYRDNLAETIRIMGA